MINVIKIYLFSSRFGAKAEIVHGLDQQWGAQAGRRVEGQFGFEQKETSVVSLLNLTSALFNNRRSQAARGLAVSQLLVIVSDGRGIFHEGKEKVNQAVMRARQAGYFCLFLIVENPENKDSVLDIRLPVFKDGQLASIDSYMEHFPFQHYIVLRWQIFETLRKKINFHIFPGMLKLCLILSATH